MKIRERPEFATKPEPLTCNPADTVQTAVERMAERNFGSIVAINPDRTIAGMVTERDIFRRIIAEHRDPLATRVSDIMTTELRVARADDDLMNWLRVMSNERFRRLPIVDEEQKLIAIMTQGDFVSYTWPELLTQARLLARSTASSNFNLLAIIIAVLFYSGMLVAIILLLA